MAVLTIAPFDASTDSANIQNPIRGVQTLDLIVGGQQLDSDDEVVIQCDFNEDIIIAILDTGGGAVVSIGAGAYPPSPHAGKGAKAYTIATTDLVLIFPEAGRHIQADGDMSLTSTEQVLVWVFRAPAGFVGVGHMNRVTIPAAPAHV